MGSEQSMAYAKAINEYRAASEARVLKSTTCKSGGVGGLLPKRQISNYFMQFRKVFKFSLKFTFILIFVAVLNLMDGILMSDSKSSLIS